MPIPGGAPGQADGSTQPELLPKPTAGDGTGRALRSLPTENIQWSRWRLEAEPWRTMLLAQRCVGCARVGGLRSHVPAQVSTCSVLFKKADV